MRALVVLSLLLPLSAALQSLQCVNKCMGEPQLNFLTRMIGLSADPDSSESRETSLDLREEMCNHTESTVKCLEACEPSDQQEYFHEWTVKWHSFGCNGTDEELRERMRDFRGSLSCFDNQQDLLLVKAAAVLMARGANPSRNPEENLCE
ncbi:hypothetical protein AAVH_31476 [Aphelenchoides avenae]|nr:hypothetical protein AAVH_31476 [Aphelenchus avenae]